MLPVIEILLTIFAWRKGWKWLALIPMGVCVGIGFIIGVAIGASGGSVESAGGAMILDIIAIIVLIIMLIKSPKPKEVTEQSTTVDPLTKDNNETKNE